MALGDSSILMIFVYTCVFVVLRFGALHCWYGHVKEACPRFIERSGLFVAVACGAFFVPVLFKFNHEHQGDEINPFSFVTKQTKPKERKSRATVINTDDPKKQAHKRYGEKKKHSEPVL